MESLGSAQSNRERRLYLNTFRYRCQICPERFLVPEALRRHCYEMHGEQSTLSCLKCEFCKMEFATLETLDKHLSTHRLEKTHRCTTCDQRFSMLNQLVEHVKMHSTLSMVPAPKSAQIDKTPEETAWKDSMNPREETAPRSERFSNPQGKRSDGVSNKPVKHLYDFRPSKFQPIILGDQSPAQMRNPNPNAIYGELAVGNWARGNRYLPIRPKDGDVLGKNDNTEPISPQQMFPSDTLISSRAYAHDPTSSEGKMGLLYRSRSIEVRDNKQTSMENATQVRRSIAESPKNQAIYSGNTTEQYESSKEPSENHPTSFRTTHAEHDGSRTPPRPMIVNACDGCPPSSLAAGRFADRSFATYHAIAKSRSKSRTLYGERRDEIASRKQQIPHKHVPVSDRYDPTSARHDPMSDRHDPMSDRDDPMSDLREQMSENTPSGVHYYPVVWSREHFEVSVEPDVTMESEKDYLVDNRTESSLVNQLDVRKQSSSLVAPSYADQLRSQSNLIQRSSGPARTDSIEVPRELDEVQNTTHKNSERPSFNNIEMNPSKIRDIFKSSKPRSGPTVFEHRDLSYSEPTGKRKYTCLNCRLEFYHESALIEHTCDIFAEILYACLVCKKEFKEYDQLQNHMKRHWRQQVFFRCTACGARLSSEELLKEHNLKHLKDNRTERHDTVCSDRDRNHYHGVAYDRTQEHSSESFITPPGSAKSPTSPVISSISGNVVTKPKDSEHIEQTNLTSRQPSDANSDSYLPYYEARKQAPDYLNVLSQGPAMVVSAMNTQETIGRNHMPNGLLYPPTFSRSAYPTNPR